LEEVNPKLAELRGSKEGEASEEEERTTRRVAAIGRVSFILRVIAE